MEKEQKVQALFDDVAGFSRTSKDFLETNGDNIIRLSKQGQAQLPLFAKYAPEYPCLLKGIVGAIPREAQAFRDYTLHINLEVLPKQPRGYNTSDAPANDEHGEHAAPLGQCEKAIHGVYGQKNLPPDSLVPPIKDGVNYAAPLGKKRVRDRLRPDLGLRRQRLREGRRAARSPAPPWASRATRSPTWRPCCSRRWPAGPR